MVTTVHERGEVVSVRGPQTPLLRLGRTSAGPSQGGKPEEGIIVVVESGESARGLLVDELIGKQEVVIKNLGETFAAEPAGRRRNSGRWPGWANIGRGYAREMPKKNNQRRPGPLGILCRRIPPPRLSPLQPGRYLTFKLGRESYGLPVLGVREIIRLCPITPVPDAGVYQRGHQPPGQSHPNSRPAGQVSALH